LRQYYRNVANKHIYSYNTARRPKTITQLLTREVKKELSYSKQIKHQLRTQYVESIYRPKY